MIVGVTAKIAKISLLCLAALCSDLSWIYSASRNKHIYMNMGRNNFESCKMVETHNDMPAGSDPVYI